MNASRIGLLAAVTCVVVGAMIAASAETAAAKLSAQYPGLTGGALSLATLGELPEGVLLQSGDVTVNASELDTELAKAEFGIKEQLEKNQVFLLENLAVRKLLLEAARKTAQPDPAVGVEEKDLIQGHIEGVVANLQVTDEEVAKFYEENKEACGSAGLEQIKDQIKVYVLEQKKQDAVTEYIRTFGERTAIVVAAAWVKEQAQRALDNPVDKARASGKPSVVDFGSTGCRPCDMMAPILETLKAKYAGKANILFVHVREQQILASRYGIQSIPVQVFFDKDGKEVYRHTGFYPQPDIEKRLSDLGVQ